MSYRPLVSLAPGASAFDTSCKNTRVSFSVSQPPAYNRGTTRSRHVTPLRLTRGTGVPTMSRPPRPARLPFRSLEDRLAPATDVLSFHGDPAGTGVIATESALTPANVAVGQFGKRFGVGLDGQVYTQPLVKSGV